MKNIIFILFGVLLLAACSTPKYTYFFDRYDYNSGRKNKTAENELTFSQERLNSPLAIEEGSLVASTDQKITLASETQSSVTPVTDPQAAQKKFSSMTKAEKKAFKKELKAEVKTYFKSKKKSDNGNSTDATKVMDYNLKMALIFGAVALVLSFFGGVNSIFWILSVVALVVGVVFFIKWLAEQ